MNTYTTNNGKVRQYTEPLNFVIIDLNTQAHLLKEVSISAMRNLDTDGIVIKNFLPSDEINAILQNLMAQPENAPEKLVSSKTFPASYANLEPGSHSFHEDLNCYYLLAKNFYHTFTETYGVNVVQKLAAIFSSLNGGAAAKVASTPNGGSYLPVTFRMIMPTKNHINMHCGNQFVSVYPDFYRHLLSVAEVGNQLSFFTVLSKPEQGGELSVYNVAWDVAKECKMDEQALRTEEGKLLHADNPNELYRRKFNLDPGDLIIFSGGQLWHRVEEVYGLKMRITVGGFIGFSRTNDDIYFWS